MTLATLDNKLVSTSFECFLFDIICMIDCTELDGVVGLRRISLEALEWRDETLSSSSLEYVQLSVALSAESKRSSVIQGYHTYWPVYWNGRSHKAYSGCRCFTAWHAPHSNVRRKSFNFFMKLGDWFSFAALFRCAIDPLRFSRNFISFFAVLQQQAEPVGNHPFCKVIYLIFYRFCRRDATSVVARLPMVW